MMMTQIVIWISVFVFGLFPAEEISEQTNETASVGNLSVSIALPAPVIETPAGLGTRLYSEMELTGIIDQQAFVSAYTSLLKHSKASKSVLAIADMTLPSTEKRLFLVDIKSKRFIMRTYVAHGTNTGELYAKQFSNRVGSHQTSKGLYEIGHRIISPKHGPALMLYGLEKGLNHNAEVREIIMHKADYVSKEFIKENGHLGRSWGCPAVSETAMPIMLRYLTNKGVLYVHGE